MFCSVLVCAKSAHVFQKLSYSFCRLCLSFLTNTNSSSGSKAFLRFIAFLGSPNSSKLWFFFLWCKGMASGHSHKLTTSRGLRYYTVGHTLNSQMHRPIPLHCMHYGITLWAYLSEPLVNDKHKHLSLMEKPHFTVCSKSCNHALPFCMRWYSLTEYKSIGGKAKSKNWRKSVIVAHSNIQLGAFIFWIFWFWAPCFLFT